MYDDNTPRIGFQLKLIMRKNPYFIQISWYYTSHSFRRSMVTDVVNKKGYQFARKNQGKVDFRLISNKYSSKIISY